MRRLGRLRQQPERCYRWIGRSTVNGAGIFLIQSTGCTPIAWRVDAVGRMRVVVSHRFEGTDGDTDGDTESPGLVLGGGWG
jgi:hypothetical protein